MALPTFRRTTLFARLLARLREPRRFIQVLAGPRQVGKTTLARQVLEAIDLPTHYASADDPTIHDRAWLQSQWDLGRLRASDEARRGAVLVIDEVQKIRDWSNLVKRLWDEDTGSGVRLRVVVLGSAPLLVQEGLTESLAGRFELIRVPHWSFSDVHDAFAWSVDRFVYYGGYPGAAPLVGNHDRWARYILDSLIETTLSRDILLMTRVDKPALLRQLFRLACDYSGQILSYQKMLGQLQDAGNTTTLAHYLHLLSSAGLVTGLEKFSGSRVRQRGSSPKLIVLNSALMTAASPLAFRPARADAGFWGRLVESAVGAHLLNSAGPNFDVFYWRERGREVDFVVRAGRTVVAIEVASGRRKDALAGLDAFRLEFRPRRTLLVGAQGIPLQEFLSTPADKWMR